MPLIDQPSIVLTAYGSPGLALLSSNDQNAFGTSTPTISRTHVNPHPLSEAIDLDLAG